MIETIFPSIPAIAAGDGARPRCSGSSCQSRCCRLRVKTDPRVDRVLEALPGANCGACGMPGCSAYATRIVEEKYAIDLCPVGGRRNRRGKSRRSWELTYAGGMKPVTARVHCRGRQGRDDEPLRIRRARGTAARRTASWAGSRPAGTGAWASATAGAPVPSTPSP